MSSIYDNVLVKFENNLLENLRSDSMTGKLAKDGRLRERMRAEIKTLLGTVGFEPQDQLRFLQMAGKAFEKYGEYNMAQDTMELVIDKISCITDEVRATAIEIDAIHAVARCSYAVIVASDQHQLAPMAVGKILGCLQKICESLDLFLGLSTKDQESHAYLALNSCKLLFDMAQPLIWISCGKYVIEMLLFGLISMSSVINLCTPRHLTFRMKMYSAAFIAAVTQETTDMAIAVLNHAVKAVKELRTREELETPVPPLTIRILSNAECDLDVLKQVLIFWKDADSFNPAAEGACSVDLNGTSKTFAERCFLECCRTQQLTTGNINEPWKKRSRGLLRAFTAYTDREEFDLAGLGTRCVSDMMSSVLYDVAADETGVAKLRALVKRKLEQVGAINPSDEDSVVSSSVVEQSFDIKQLHLLNQLLVVMDTKVLTKQNLTVVKTYLINIAELSFTDELMKRRTFLQRAAIGVWNRCVFPSLNIALCRDATGPKDGLKILAPSLLSIVEISSISMSHDPVFVGTVAVATAHVLREIGWSRQCVQHLLRALDYIDEHRAARTDIRLQYPEEVRDITALQYQSISIRSEYKNWFHAFKRLGAHAFAGFGIFGSSSSMFRGDVALAEIHADLLTCYFSEELAYAIHCRNLRGSDAVEQKSDKTKKGGTLKNGKTKAATAVEAEPVSLVKIADPDATEESKLVAHVADMAVSKQLRSWCKKNNYAKCLLFLEMARVEALGDERGRLLSEAVKCVQAAELQERDLINAFSDLTVMTDKDIKRPIVLSRSHKYFYIIPVGCRAQKKAHYYKVLAREEGSGTALGATSDELAGCDLPVLFSSLQYPSAQVAVRIEVPLPNERYVFGSAAYRENGQLLSQHAVSPTTMAVEALNPLPTVSLWGQIAQISSLFEDCISYAHEAAAIVCSRYFMISPRQNVRSVGRMGHNLFACEEPAISALVVSQSSESQLYMLVKCFIISQKTAETGVERFLREIEVHGSLRADDQVAVLNTLKRLALVTIIASYIKSHELVSQCVYLGYQLCSQVLREDDVALSAHLSQPLIVFVASMQQIPKEQWHEIDHNLFCRLVAEAVKCAIITKNTEAFSRLIEKVHPDGSPSLVDEKAESLSNVYMSLVAVLNRGHGFFMSHGMKTQLASMCLGPVRTDLQLWQLSPLERSHVLRGMAEEVVLLKAAGGGAAAAPAAGKTLKSQASTISKTTSKIDPTALAASSDLKAYTADQVLLAWSASKPKNMSVLISAIVMWANELLAKGRSDLVVSLVKGFPIKRHTLTPAMQKLCGQWNFVFLDNNEEPEPEAMTENPPAGDQSPRSAAGSQPNSRPGTAGTDDGNCDNGDVNNAVETSAQLRAIGELSLILAEILLLDESIAEKLRSDSSGQAPSSEEAAVVKASRITPKGGRRVHYPTSMDGPLALIDTHDPEACLLQQEINSHVEAPSAPIAEEQSALVAEEANPLVALRYMCAALVLFNQAGLSNAAIDVACRLWNIVSDGWVHPKTFALECMAAPDPSTDSLPTLTEGVEEAEGTEIVAKTQTSASDPEDGKAYTMKKVILVTTEALAKVLEVISRIFEDEDLGAADGFFPGQDNEMSGEVPALVLATCTRRESMEYLYNVRSISNYLIKILWLFRDWREVVEIGTRITAVYAQRSTLDISRAIMESTWGYIIHSQAQLVKLAREDENSMQADLDKFIGDWQDAQSKKRKKKARIARVEKDDDEIAFENERSEIEEKLQRLNTLLQVEQNRLDGFTLDQKRILGSQPIGIQLLDRVRHAYRDFMLECYTCLSPAGMKHVFELDALDPITGSSTLPMPEQRQDAFAAILDNDRVLAAKFDSIQHDYDEISSFFREKKDLAGIVESLQEQGDVLLLFGKAAEARAIWNDAIDGVFHSIDAVKQWQRLIADAMNHAGASHEHFVACAFPLTAILGKLSAFCASNDFDRKSEYCRLAATLCRIPFSESIGHPKTAPGLSTYECHELGGVGYLVSNQTRLSPSALSFSLHEIIDVLISEKEFLLALPCIVLLEHLHCCYTMRSDFWLQARLKRIRVLVDLHFFSEAASMLAGISTGVQMVAARKHNVPLAEFEALHRRTHNIHGGSEVAAGSSNKSMYEVRENGFDYFGFAPYWNHLPPHADKNKEAISWISSYSSKLWQDICSLPHLRMDLPASMLPPPESEPAAGLGKSGSTISRAASSVPKGDLKTAGKQKSVSGKQPSTVAGAAVNQPDPSDGPSMDCIITTRHLSALKIECIFFVLELLGLDTKVSSVNRACMLELTGAAETDLTDLLRQLADEAAKSRELEDNDDVFAHDTSGQRSPRGLASRHHNRNCWCDADWVAQFCRCNLYLSSLLAWQKRDFISARAGIVCFQKVLLHGVSIAKKESGPVDVPYGVLLAVKTSWVRANAMLAEISARQGRFDDAIRLATRGAEEASAMCWSHWLRLFLLQRAQVNMKVGKLDLCENDCNIVLSSFDFNCDVLLNGVPKQLYVSHSAGKSEPPAAITSRTRQTISLVRALLLKASVTRIVSINSSSETGALSSLRHCIKLTKAAVNMAKYLATSAGFLGSDANVSYITALGKGNNSMISDHHLLPPLIHNLTEIHPNDPLLSIDPVSSSSKKARGDGVSKSIATTVVDNIYKKGITTGDEAGGEEKSLYLDSMRQAREDVLSQYSDKASLGFFHRPDIRLGPTDGIGNVGECVVYTASEFANIYLTEVLVLATCISALGKIITDAEPLLSSERASKVSLFGRAPLSAIEDEEPEEEDIELPIEVFAEQVTEEGLKLLRHIVYPSIFLRAGLLLNAGVFRARPRISGGINDQGERQLLNVANTSTVLSPVKGGNNLAKLGALQADPVPGEAKLFDDFSRMGKACVDPLRKCLEISVTGKVNPWESMRAACIQLVECYGSDRLDWANDDAESDPVHRLSMSAFFLKMAIHLNGCIRNLNEAPLDMTADKSFASPCPIDIANLLESITSSSVSRKRVAKPAAPQTAAVEPAAAAKGGKAPATTTAAAPIASSSLTGRDALFALSALYREVDPLWTEGYEYDFISDLHASLASNFAIYAEKCAVTAIPNTQNIELKVETCSVSSLWVLGSNDETRSRGAQHGLFDGTTGYFLLGAPQQSSSSDPLLTKINLLYSELVHLEMRAAKLRDHFILKNISAEAIAEDCQALLIQLYGCLKQGSVDTDISAQTKHEDSGWVIDLTESSLSSARSSGNGKRCSFQISLQSLSILVSALSYRTGSSNISENSVCSFLWFCFSQY